MEMAQFIGRHKIEPGKPAVLWVIPAAGAASGRLTFGVFATNMIDLTSQLLLPGESREVIVRLVGWVLWRT